MVLIGKGFGDISPTPSPTSDFNGSRSLEKSEVNRVFRIVRNLHDIVSGRIGSRINVVLMTQARLETEPYLIAIAAPAFGPADEASTRNKSGTSAAPP